MTVSFSEVKFDISSFLSYSRIKTNLHFAACLLASFQNGGVIVKKEKENMVALYKLRAPAVFDAVRSS